MFSIKNSSKSYCSWRWQIRQIPLGGHLSRVPTLCSAFFTCWVLLTQTNSGDTAVMGVPEASQRRAERSPEAVHHQGQSDHPHFYPNIPPLGISQAPSCQQAKQTGYIPHWQRVWPHLFSPVLSPTLWPLWPAHLALDTLGIWASCVTPSSGLEWPSWSYSVSISSYDPHGMSQPLSRTCGLNSPVHTFLPLPQITRGLYCCLSLVFQGGTLGITLSSSPIHQTRRLRPKRWKENIS